MTNIVLDARTATPHFPGIGRYVRSLAEALLPQLAADERLTLLVDAQQPLHLAGAHSVPLAVTPFSLGQQWRIPAQLRRASADLYHSPYYLMPYLPGARTLLTVYDVIPLRHPEFSSRRSRLLYRLTTRLALRTAGRVIAITEAARQDFIGEFGVRPERITAIPLAADPVFRPQPEESVAAVRAKYALPESYVLYVGSAKPHKNLAGLVQAWRGLAEAARPGPPPASLVIAGAWDEPHPEARRLAAGDSGIRWLGRAPDQELPALYAGAALFVFPSFFEGFGLPVLEAMACGAAVACSRVSALPEVVGDAAVLFDPADTAGLTRVLQSVLDDPPLRAALQARGLARAAGFSWSETARRTLAQYRALYGAGP